MTYSDDYQYDTTYMRDDFIRLRDAAGADKPRLFVEYCRTAIAAETAGKMPLRDAAYSIAGVMFIKQLSDTLFDDITSLAGELELPAEFVDGQPELKWQELVTLVDSYDKAHKTEAWLEKVEREQAEMQQRTNEAFKEHDES